MSRLIKIAKIAVASLLLAGCSAAPRLIGSYPKLPPAQPLAQPVTVVYDATLELDVRDADWAARRAEDLASRYGGYLADSVSWSPSGHFSTRLTLAVPAANFDALHMALLDLGDLVSEHLSSRETRSGYPAGSRYSYITITLHSINYERPGVQPYGWNPLSTLTRTFQVSVAIFGFAVNALIWVVVVAGPFVLLGWGLRALLRRQGR